MQPLEAQTFVREEMAAVFPVSNLRDRRARSRPGRAPRPVEDLPAHARTDHRPRRPRAASSPRRSTLRIKVAGFGGQGVLMLGEVLAEAGLEAGYEVSWLPSYGPEMRSGTSNCHVRLSNSPIDSPAGLAPQRAARDERAVAAQVSPQRRARRHRALQWRERRRRIASGATCAVLARPFTEIADGLGASKVANIVMLGALLETTALLDQERVDRRPAAPRQESPVVRPGRRRPRPRPRRCPSRRRLSLGRLAPLWHVRPQEPRRRLRPHARALPDQPYIAAPERRAVDRALRLRRRSRGGTPAAPGGAPRPPPSRPAPSQSASTARRRPARRPGCTPRSAIAAALSRCNSRGRP